MTLVKSRWKSVSAVILAAAGVLMFAGGALGAEVTAPANIVYTAGTNGVASGGDYDVAAPFEGKSLAELFPASGIVAKLNGTTTHSVVDKAVTPVPVVGTWGWEDGSIVPYVVPTTGLEVKLKYTITPVAGGYTGSAGASGGDYGIIGSSDFMLLPVKIKLTAAAGDLEGTVTITGTPTVGQVLTADISGLTSPGAARGLQYQWKADGVNIGSAVSNTFTLTNAQFGKRITVMVTTPNYSGNATKTSVATSAVATDASDATASPAGKTLVVEADYKGGPFSTADLTVHTGDGTDWDLTPTTGNAASCQVIGVVTANAWHGGDNQTVKFLVSGCENATYNGLQDGVLNVAKATITTASVTFMYKKMYDGTTALSLSDFGPAQESDRLVLTFPDADWFELDVDGVSKRPVVYGTTTSADFNITLATTAPVFSDAGVGTRTVTWGSGGTGSKITLIGQTADDYEFTGGANFLLISDIITAQIAADANNAALIGITERVVTVPSSNFSATVVYSGTKTVPFAMGLVFASDKTINVTETSESIVIPQGTIDHVFRAVPSGSNAQFVVGNATSGYIYDEKIVTSGFSAKKTTDNTPATASNYKLKFLAGTGSVTKANIVPTGTTAPVAASAIAALGSANSDGTAFTMTSGLTGLGTITWWYLPEGSSTKTTTRPIEGAYDFGITSITSGVNYNALSLQTERLGSVPSDANQLKDFSSINLTEEPAMVLCSLQVYKVLYTRENTGFKITSGNDPRIYILDSLKAGRFGEWKPWRITYKAPTGSKTVKYEPKGGSWSTDKGVQVGMLTAEIQAGKTPTQIANISKSDAANIIDWVDICGNWEVTVEMVNVNTLATPEGQARRGVRVTSKATMQVVPRTLSDREITVTATLSDKVFDGKEKQDLVLVEVFDGTARLTDGIHFSVLDRPTAVDSGKYTITVEGKNCYMNTKNAEFVIVQQVIRMDMSNPGKDYGFTKVYDGTKAVDTSTYDFAIKFVEDETGKVIGEDLKRGDDFRVSGLAYTDANAGSDKTVTATITLVSNSPVAKNYKLKSGNFSVGKQVIEKAVPTDSMVTVKLGSRSFILPASVPEDAKTGRTLELSWTDPIKSTGAKFTVIYPENWPKGTKDTLPQGTYQISANITEGANTAAIEGLELGVLTIRDPNLPDIVRYSPVGKDTSYYSTKGIKIAVVGANPEGGKGTLSYQWYIVREGESGDSLLRGKTSSELSLNDVVLAATQITYYSVVTYTAPNEQKSASLKSDNITVTVYPKPVSLASALIVPNQSYIYTGTDQIVTSSDFTVTLGDNTLTEGVHFTYKGARNNRLAGEGIIVIKGINAYEDSAVGTFEIAKKQVVVGTDLNVKYSVPFTGAPQTLAVSAISPLTGLGAVSVIIGDTGWSTRTDAGSWPVRIAIAEGMNFEALDTTDNLPQNFRITKAIPDTSMFTFSVTNQPFTGSPVVVAAPVAKGLGLLYSNSATNEVLYNGSATAPTAMGNYTVELSIKGDNNFSSYVLRLGTMAIYDPTISVAEGSREIPNGSAVTEAAVAPVKVTAAGVTFGPNPVNAGSAVSVFWNGSKPVAGKLAVFTEMGRKVETLKVSGTKKIGTWNTAKAPAGTYLVKGVLKDRDGNKVTVNSVVSVGK